MNKGVQYFLLIIIMWVFQTIVKVIVWAVFLLLLITLSWLAWHHFFHWSPA
jgi:hypothetical protein